MNLKKKPLANGREHSGSRGQPVSLSLIQSCAVLGGFFSTESIRWFSFTETIATNFPRPKRLQTVIAISYKPYKANSSSSRIYFIIIYSWIVIVSVKHINPSKTHKKLLIWCIRSTNSIHFSIFQMLQTICMQIILKLTCIRIQFPLLLQLLDDERGISSSKSYAFNPH